MGYESRIYVINKSCLEPDEDGFRFAEMIAKFNLCKCGGDFCHEIGRYPNTEYYIYEGNEKVTEDKYGDHLTEIPVKDMIRILKDCAKKGEYYRRWQPCIGLLQGFDENDWDGDLAVLHYGY